MKIASRLAAAAALASIVASGTASAVAAPVPTAVRTVGQPLPIAARAGSRIPSAGLQPAAYRGAVRMNPANCTPNVWASSVPNYPNPSVVIGYSGASPCVMLTGASPTSLFTAAFGLATDANGFLYVADYLNDRVVVFTKTGAYYSTLDTTPNIPVKVCVSHQGIVAAVTQTGASTGMVEFFKSKGQPNDVTPPYSSTPTSYSDYGCAFDKRGDFFTADYQQIAYLRNNNVFTVNPPLQICASAICTHDWFSMYSVIRSGNVNTLSAHDWSGATIRNFKVNLGPPNQLVFVTWGVQPTTTFSGPPNPATYQIAPSAGPNNTSRLYYTDYLNSAVEWEPNKTVGGPSTLFAGLANAWGVATFPTGQY